ncbi:MAG: UMP kinase [Candidatus Thorarchaeota archaeon]|nr:UMP kinase [Candidatus Thorarchaeota archaeon]
MRIVLKIGGSLLYQDNRIQVEMIEAYAKEIRKAIGTGHDLVVVVGGGASAREFIAAARSLGGSEANCDFLGIELARKNAELFTIALGNQAYPEVVESLSRLEVARQSGRVVFMGGLTPGQSTNAVAALAAEITGADILLNATNVEGVYDRDPKEGNAVLLEELSIDQLNEILSKGGTRAGEYQLFDPVAIRIVRRSKIRTVFFDGRDVDNLSRILKGEKIGSSVVYKKSK